VVRPFRNHLIRDVDRSIDGRSGAHSWRGSRRPTDVAGLLQQPIATPSMKAALEAWGADSNLFTRVPRRRAPIRTSSLRSWRSVVLKGPVGSGGPFGEHADCRKNLGEGRRKMHTRKRLGPKAKKSSAQPDKPADRKAVQAYERERQRRARGGQGECSEAEERARRQKAVD
jgi:hypothetical protein